MKLPSINYLFEKAKISLLRFPITLLCAFIAVCIAIYLIEYQDDIKNFFPFINLLIVSALGIPLFFGLSIFISSKNYSLLTNLISHCLAGLILVAIYFSLPDSDSTHNTFIPYIRYGIFNIIVHLLVSFSPFIKGKKLNGFWNFNKILFIRFLTSVLYSGFLYVGLILALTSLNILFDIEIHEELYFEIYIVIIGIFNTWFFVSGIPTNLEELENINEYPKGLKIFAQYVLLPLLVLYLVILYAYGAKILIYWDWPKGIVSYLISCVSVLGILTVLLFYPYGLLKDNAWIKKFTKAFYFSLFPLIAILFIAIGIRIGDYGITINRYVIVLLGFWLIINASYFSFVRSNIKFVPMSLAIILGLMSFGPWGMFAISENNQTNRLLSILNNNNLIKNGKNVNEVIWETDSLPNQLYSITPNTNENILNDSLHNEVKSILDYLDDHHGLSKVRPLFQQNIDSLIIISLDSNKNINEARIYMQTMGLKYEHKYSSNNLNHFTYSSKEENLIPISTYDYLLNFNHYGYNRSVQLNTFVVDGLSYTLANNIEENDELTLLSENDTIHFNLNQMINHLKNEFGTGGESNIDKSKMTLKGESNTIRAKIQLQSISLEEVNDSTSQRSIQGSLFLKMKK